jgi:hypothetical protein
MTSVGYKKRQQTVEREGIITSLRSQLTLPENCQVMSESADALDAVVCILAGADFVRGSVQGPKDTPLAAREGWIWFPASAEDG